MNLNLIIGLLFKENQFLFDLFDLFNFFLGLFGIVYEGMQIMMVYIIILCYIIFWILSKCIDYRIC